MKQQRTSTIPAPIFTKASAKVKKQESQKTPTIPNQKPQMVIRQSKILHIHRSFSEGENHH
tara:strand:- start:366 stop:548 length:183 start_codon:yes stop_codon:yes gene_type:complete